MSETKKLQNEQQFLISECKRHIESNKLSLWGYKAELASLSSQYKKLKHTLENQEKAFYYVRKEVVSLTNQMRGLEEAISKQNFEGLIETSSPYPIIQDIGTAICVIIGSMTPSWDEYRVISI